MAGRDAAAPRLGPGNAAFTLIGAPKVPILGIRFAPPRVALAGTGGAHLQVLQQSVMRTKSPAHAP